jgi:hypothetical protein
MLKIPIMEIANLIANNHWVICVYVCPDHFWHTLLLYEWVSVCVLWDRTPCFARLRWLKCAAIFMTLSFLEGVNSDESTYCDTSLLLPRMVFSSLISISAGNLKRFGKTDKEYWKFAPPHKKCSQSSSCGVRFVNWHPSHLLTYPHTPADNGLALNALLTRTCNT